MLQFSDRSNELYKISFSSPYDLREIKNYYNDIPYSEYGWNVEEEKNETI